MKIKHKKKTHLEFYLEHKEKELEQLEELIKLKERRVKLLHNRRKTITADITATKEELHERQKKGSKNEQ